MDEEVDYGRIALIPKGDFAGDVQYDVGDVVSYEGSSYIAKRKPPVATLPTDTEYWQISSQGSKYIYINLTTAEYSERLAAYRADPSYIDPDTGTLFSETLYNVTDDYESLLRKAENITYTDTFMIGATDVQGIIDIIGDKVGNLEDNFLTASKSVYVDATNGDDTTGDGSQEKPWATIQKAVDMCPSVGDKYIYYIYLAQGTYDESIIISDKHNICIYGATTLDDSDNFKVRSMIFLGVSSFIVRGIYFYGSNETPSKIGLKAESISGIVNYCKFSDCILRTDGNSETIVTNSDFSNYQSGSVTYGAIHASCGKINCFNVSGSNNKCAYATNNSGSAGQIYISSNCTLTGDIMFDEGFTGRIHYGTSGYQLIGSVTGANSVAIDSELYTEFDVKITNGVAMLKLHLNASEMPSGSSVQTYGISCGTDVIAKLNVSRTSIVPYKITQNGTDITASAIMTVYGKR